MIYEKNLAVQFGDVDIHNHLTMKGALRLMQEACNCHSAEAGSGVNDIEKSRKIIKASLPKIERTAEETIAAQGFSYSVTASLAAVEFPEKTYGSYTFPAGIYEALEVVIGEGKGQNWWCVMYPNLCFYNSVYEVVDEKAEQSLERALTKEEYESLMENKNYEVKFALLDWLKEKISHE